MGSTILFLSLGILFILIFGGKYTSIIKRTLLFPPLWGIILGILANILHLNPGIYTFKCLEIFEWSGNSPDNDITWIVPRSWRYKKLFRCSILRDFNQADNIPNDSYLDGVYTRFTWS